MGFEGALPFNSLGVGTVKSHQRGSEFQVGKLNFSTQESSWLECSCALLDFFLFDF